MAYQLQQATSVTLGANGYAVCHDGTQLWVACNDFSIKRCTYNETTDTLTVQDSHTPMSGTHNIHIRHMIFNGRHIVAAGYLAGSYNDPYVKVFSYSGGSLTEVDEESFGTVAGTAYSKVKISRGAGDYYYATYGGNNQKLFAISINYNGLITRIDSYSLGYAPNDSSADSSYIYVAKPSSGGVDVFTFNGASLSLSSTLGTETVNSVISVEAGKVVAAGSTVSLWQVGNAVALSSVAVSNIDHIIYDGTYIIGHSTIANTINSFLLASDVLSITSNVAQYTTTDPVRLSWWKNKVFAANTLTDIYAYKNAITGLASVTPTIGQAPLAVTFSVT